MNRAYVLRASLLIGLTCCNTGIVEPSMDIEVAKEGTGYKFSFKECGRSWLPDGPMPVSDVYVRKGVGQADSLPLQCEVTRGPSVRQLRGQWQYGTTPPGYTMSRCDPLEPGETYQVSAGGPPFGRRVFTVKENGDVAMGKSLCR